MQVNNKKYRIVMTSALSEVLNPRANLGMGIYLFIFCSKPFFSKYEIF